SLAVEMLSICYSRTTPTCCCLFINYACNNVFIYAVNCLNRIYVFNYYIHNSYVRDVNDYDADYDCWVKSASTTTSPARDSNGEYCKSSCGSNWYSIPCNGHDKSGKK